MREAKRARQSIAAWRIIRSLYLRAEGLPKVCGMTESPVPPRGDALSSIQERFPSLGKKNRAIQGRMRLRGWLSRRKRSASAVARGCGKDLTRETNTPRV